MSLIRAPNISKVERLIEIEQNLEQIRRNHYRCDLKRHVDGDFLRDIMPEESKFTIKRKHLDVMEADCVQHMEKKARDGKWYCRYHIKVLYPGLPKYDQKEMMENLRLVLRQRKGILVKIHSYEECILYVSWDPENINK